MDVVHTIEEVKIRNSALTSPSTTSLKTPIKNVQVTSATPYIAFPGRGLYEDCDDDNDEL